jgi:hypothetical protein
MEYFFTPLATNSSKHLSENIWRFCRIILAEQSEATSTYQQKFQFFNPTPSESNIPTTNHQSRTPEVIIEGSKESHVQVKMTPLPPNVRMHEWEIPEETHE